MPSVQKLLNLREYRRPAAEAPDRALDHALALLARPDVQTVPLAGGNTLLASANQTVEAVVDLQGLGLDGIQRSDQPPALHIGAMATRAALSGHEDARTLFSGLLAEGARRWGGSVQRNRATVGGAVAVAAANDPLIVALLACDAQVVVRTPAGSSAISLADFLQRRAELLKGATLITEVIVPWPALPGGGASAVVARTPADAPIVLAAATLTLIDGRCAAARLALGGVADHARDLSAVAAALVGETISDEALAAVAARIPPLISSASDYLGSGTYRKAMAQVLSVRALREAWQRAG